MAIIADLIKYTRLAWDLRDFLRGTLTLEQSQQIIINRLQERERNFLSLVQKGIYQNPGSPYLKLLRIAGCEFGDIESLVKQDGLDAALRQLLTAGVYFSWEEFKGKTDVIRGNRRFRLKPKDLDNPFLSGYYQVKSSGTRSTGTRTIFDIGNQLEKAVYHLPMRAANNVPDVPLGIWKPVLPSVSGIANVLAYWKVGRPVVRWFSPVDEKQVQASLRDRLAMRYIIYGSRLWGAKLAKPEYVPLNEADIIARWMANINREFGGCCLISAVSQAVKVCQAAIRKGLDIRGTHFFVSGEPFTRAKRQQIEAAGASVTPRYNVSEIGRIGFGCPGGEAIDDVHLLRDSIALVQRPRKMEHTDIHVNAFLFTSLLLSAPRILLNVESDDYGVMETRSCGCLLEQLGLNQHLYNIRSFTKVTGNGMTIAGSDFVRILEEILPGKFGGGATDYQLLEDEDDQGQTRLSLIISPEVGAVDENDVKATVLDELRRDAYGGKLAAGLWSQANILEIKRIYPMSSAGKVMTLHLVKKSN